MQIERLLRRQAQQQQRSAGASEVGQPAQVRLKYMLLGGCQNACLILALFVEMIQLATCNLCLQNFDSFEHTYKLYRLPLILFYKSKQMVVFHNKLQEYIFLFPIVCPYNCVC